MPFGFYIIMAAQFFSALADNALLIVAIAILREMSAPASYEPLLKTFFALSYIGLAAFVGAFADLLPKGRVMFISNMIKISGCVLLFLSVHPLLAYAVVGLGAAAYSPAKYGIVTEYVPHRLLVIANSWISGLTVCAIILGVVVGGSLVKPEIAAKILALDLPFIDTGIDHPNKMAIAIICCLYILAALINLYIPTTGAPRRAFQKNPFLLAKEFGHCLVTLWSDRLGQISFASTTLLWGVGATMQFIVIKWAEAALGLDLSTSSMLQGVVAIGIAMGAVCAARISLKKSATVLPVGIMLGFIVVTMNLSNHLWTAIPLLILIGTLSGFFVVPMNALLQHRGHVLLGAGRSIAVQNFNENLSILGMTGLYYLMIRFDMPIHWVIVVFGLCVSGIMYLIMRHHQANHRQYNDIANLDNNIHY